MFDHQPLVIKPQRNINILIQNKKYKYKPTGIFWLTDTNQNLHKPPKNIYTIYAIESRFRWIIFIIYLLENNVQSKNQIHSTHILTHICI